METVNRLATSVRASSTNHDSSPALVKNGSIAVDASAEHKSNVPKAEMLIKRTLLFRFFSWLIILDALGWAGLMTLPPTTLIFLRLRTRDQLKTLGLKTYPKRLSLLVQCQPRWAVLNIAFSAAWSQEIAPSESSGFRNGERRRFYHQRGEGLRDSEAVCQMLVASRIEQLGRKFHGADSGLFAGEMFADIGGRHVVYLGAIPEQRNGRGCCCGVR